MDALLDSLRHAKKPGQQSSVEMEEEDRLNFGAALIRALEDAERSAAAPRSGEALAGAAYEKLQFDFPLLAPPELEALVGRFRSGATGGYPLTPKFLAVLRESAGQDGGGSAPVGSAGQGAQQQASGGAAPPAADPLLPLFQQLFGLAVLGALQGALAAPAAAAAAQLASLAPAIDALEAAAEEGSGPAPAAGAAPDLGWAALRPRLVFLSGQLGHHCLSEDAAWEAAELWPALLACLAAARRHPRFPELQPVAAALLRLGHDRMAARPADVAQLGAVLDALGVREGAAPPPDPPAALLASSLALALGASLAGSLGPASARRRLWQELHDCLLPVAAETLQSAQSALTKLRRRRAAAQQAEQQQQEEQQQQQEAGMVAAAMVACQVVRAYAGGAPPGMATGQRMRDALLKGGLFRSLVLLALDLGADPSAEPLRRALLACAAAAPGLAAWAAEVPGFVAAAVEAPACGAGGPLELHGAVWAALLQRPGGADRLAALLRDASTPEKVCERVHPALLLLAELRATARGAPAVVALLQPPAVEAALREAAATLRTRYGSAAAEAQAAGVEAGGALSPGESSSPVEEGEGVGEGEGPGGDGAAAAKLALPPERQAALLAWRRGAVAAPECLRLAKELLARGTAPGKND